jgi:hypothetical protein
MEQASKTAARRLVCVFVAYCYHMHDQIRCVFPRAKATVDCQPRTGSAVELVESFSQGMADAPIEAHSPTPSIQSTAAEANGDG